MRRRLAALLSLFIAGLSVEACQGTIKRLADDSSADAAANDRADAASDARDASEIVDSGSSAGSSTDAEANNDAGSGGRSSDAGSGGRSNDTADAGAQGDAGAQSDADVPTFPCPLAAGVVEVLATTTDRLHFAVGGVGKYLFYSVRKVGLHRVTVCSHAIEPFAQSDANGGTWGVIPVATHGDTVIWLDDSGVRRATLELAPLPTLYWFAYGPGEWVAVDPFGGGLIVTEGRPSPYTNRSHVSLDWDGNVRGRLHDAFSNGPVLFDQNYAYACGSGPFTSRCLLRYDKDLSNLQQIPIEGETPRSMLIQDDIAYFPIGSELRQMPVAGGPVTPVVTFPEHPYPLQMAAIDETNVYLYRPGQGLVAVAIASPHNVVSVAPMADGESFVAAELDSSSLYFTVSLNFLDHELRRVSKPH